jgi:hypothetical protein
VQFPERNDSFDFIGGLDQFVKHYRVDRGIDKQRVNVSSSSMQSFAIRDGEKMTLNINMGDGKQMGRGIANRGGGGLKALKKPLAPLSKPSGSSGGSSNMMGFGMGGGAAAAAEETAPAQKEEMDLLGVGNNASLPKNDEPMDLLSAMSSGPSAPPQNDFFS